MVWDLLWDDSRPAIARKGRRGSYPSSPHRTLNNLGIDCHFPEWDMMSYFLFLHEAESQL
jgi:hypothetical protein